MRSGGRADGSKRGLFAEVAHLQKTARCAVLATPLWLRGSVPLSHQAKLLVRDDGSTRGTIGGGSLEAEVRRRAAELLESQEACVLNFELTDAEAAEEGMMCGGRCAILLEPIKPDRARDVFTEAAKAEEAGEPIVLITIVPEDGPPRKLALLANGEWIGSIADDTLRAALRDAADECRVREQPYFIEQPVTAHFDPVQPGPRLFIFGAGHVAVPLAEMAGLAGFFVTVIDDREEFANRKRFPHVDRIVVAAVADAFEELRISEDAYVVAITRGHAMDESVVAYALEARARYVGMIGSRRKVAAVRGRLSHRGFADADLARVHAPIGLDIGADTVEEIAVSIVGQLVAVRRKQGQEA